MVYKWCVVPQCTNTTVKSPQKLFVSVPTNPKRRKIWLQLSRRDPDSILSHSNVFMCEDHFDMEKDTINYMKYKMGFSQKILLADEAVPFKFCCQKDHKRQESDAGSSRDVFLRRQSLDLVTNCLQSHSTTETHAESLPNHDIMIKGIMKPKDNAGAKTADISNIRKSPDRQDGAAIDGEIQEMTEDPLFLWQRESVVKSEDSDVNPDNSTIVKETSERNNVVFGTDYDYKINSLDKTESETDERVINIDEDNDVHEGYKCDMCKGFIRRFRYSCVECANYDLCGACEARAEHPQHYLLRVPRPRPHVEIELIMDTIRRFLTADLKSLRTQAHFVSTLMDEMKSEVLSEAGSDPVPDEPDYAIQSDICNDEHEDCEMEESNATHSPAAKDDVHEITYSDENILEETEIPPEAYKTPKTINKIVINIASDTERYSYSKLSVQNVQHKPERRIIKQRDNSSPSNAVGKVSKILIVPKNYCLSPYTLVGKVSNRILGTLPKRVFISKDVLKALEAKNDADTMRNTINTIKHSFQSQVSIKVERLSKQELNSASNT